MTNQTPTKNAHAAKAPIYLRGLLAASLVASSAMLDALPASADATKIEHPDKSGEGEGGAGATDTDSAATGADAADATDAANNVDATTGEQSHAACTDDSCAYIEQIAEARAAAAEAAAQSDASPSQTGADADTEVITYSDTAETAQGQIQTTTRATLEIDYDGTATGEYTTQITNKAALTARICAIALPEGMEWTCEALGLEIAPGDTLDITWSARTNLDVATVDAMRDGTESLLGKIEYSLAYTSLPGAYTIDGAALTGEPMYAACADAPADAELAYTWYAGDTPGDQAEKIGEGAVLYPTRDNLGRYISLKVEDAGNRYMGARTAAASGFVRLTSYDGMQTQITGDTQIGGTLTAHVQNAPQVGTNALSYQWYRNGAAIAGATANTYTLTAADYDCSVTVRVDCQNELIQTVATAGSPEVVCGQVAFTANVALDNMQPAYGDTISATATDTTDGVAATFQWFRDGVAIEGATQATYTTGKDDMGATLHVQAKSAHAGYFGTVDSAATQGVVKADAAAVCQVALSGTAKAGNTVQAQTAGAPADADAQVTYKWYVEGEEITSARTAASGLQADTSTFTAQGVGGEGISQSSLDSLYLLETYGHKTLRVECTIDSPYYNLAVPQAAETNVESDTVYLSDIPYMSKSKVGYGSIVLDQNYSNSQISLIVDGTAMTFPKGVAAHATSNMYYDLRDYSDYDYLTMYAGIDSGRGSNGNGVKIYVYTSTDDVNYTLVTEDTDDCPTSTGETSARKFTIDIRGVNYVRIYADALGSNGSDHAVYGDAKLVKQEYIDREKPYEAMLDTTAADAQILAGYTAGDVSQDIQHALLKRQFLAAVGTNTLDAIYSFMGDVSDGLDWLLNNYDLLEYYMMGGAPDGSYTRSIEVLARLYRTHADDIHDTTPTFTSGAGTRGQLYARMMMALALTHSTNCGFWAGGTQTDGGGPNGSDAVTRYEIFKRMYLAGKLDNHIFETRTVEEMRFVVNSIIDDESIEWLRDFTAANTSNSPRNPYTYITYGGDLNYLKDEFYDPEMYDYWNSLYKFDGYGITYEYPYPKPWIVLEANGVCGAISKTGATIQNSYGVPASVISQPGHAAYIFQTIDSLGRTNWGLWNNVSGWALSGRTEKLYIRMLCGWVKDDVSTNTDTTWPTTYTFLAQECLDDYENYVRAQKILMQLDLLEAPSGEGEGDAIDAFTATVLQAAGVNTDGMSTTAANVRAQEAIYRDALAAQPKNFNGWLGLARLFAENEDIYTEDNCLGLAQEIAEVYKYQPLPMHDLLRIIEPRIQTTGATVAFNLAKTNALKASAGATFTDSAHYDGIKVVANALLGNVDATVATFSFDGDAANTIKLAEMYRDSGTVWDFSLDGGQTWSAQIEADDYTLTEDDLARINPDSDILIHIVGVSYNAANYFAIDITQAAAPTSLYVNDTEDRAIGVTEQMEWRLVPQNAGDADWDGTGLSEWTGFKDDINHRFKGDVKVEIRVAANGQQMQSESAFYSFTEGEEPNPDKAYVYVSRIVDVTYSSQQNATSEAAVNVFDGRADTLWHTKWDKSDQQRWVAAELDAPTWFSAIDYLPRTGAGNGTATAISVYVSENGTDWTQAAQVTGLKRDQTTKHIAFDTPVYGKYIKIQIDEGHNTFGSAAQINLYESLTAVNGEGEDLTP